MWFGGGDSRLPTREENVIELDLTLYGKLDGTDRQFWCSGWIIESGQISWLGSTGTTERALDAVADGFALLRQHVVAPEFQRDPAA